MFGLMTQLFFIIIIRRLLLTPQRRAQQQRRMQITSMNNAAAAHELLIKHELLPKSVRFASHHYHRLNSGMATNLDAFCPAFASSAAS